MNIAETVTNPSSFKVVFPFYMYILFMYLNPTSIVFNRVKEGPMRLQIATTSLCQVFLRPLINLFTLYLLFTFLNNF